MGRILTRLLIYLHKRAESDGESAGVAFVRENPHSFGWINFKLGIALAVLGIVLSMVGLLPMLSSIASPVTNPPQGKPTTHLDVSQGWGIWGEKLASPNPSDHQPKLAAAVAKGDPERAFIVVDGLSEEKVSESPDTIRYVPQIRNDGSTPAFIEEMMTLTPSTSVFVPRDFGLVNRDFLDLREEIAAPGDPEAVFARFKAGQIQSDEQDRKFLDAKDRIAFSKARRTAAGMADYDFTVGPKSALRTRYFLEEDGDYSVSDIPRINHSYLKDHFFFGLIRYRDYAEKQHVRMYCYSVGMFTKDTSGRSRLLPPQRCEYWNCEDDQCSADRVRFNREMSQIFAENDRTPKDYPQRDCELRIGKSPTALEELECAELPQVIKRGSMIPEKVSASGPVLP